MTIHNRIYKVMMQSSTVNGTVKILYGFIGTDIVPYHAGSFLEVSIRRPIALWYASVAHCSDYVAILLSS